MIPHHAAMVVIVDITRVLIHQMLHLILAVKHQHQCDDGKLATGTCMQIAFAAPCIGINRCNKLLHVAAFYGLARLGIHLVGILIRRIVREVAANHKEVFVRKIRLQHLRHPLQFVVIVR